MLLLAASRQSGAQHPSESVWSFGREAVVDFSSLAPVVTTLPNNGGAPLYAYYRWSATVCDNSGRILFWAKMANSVYSLFNVFDRNGQTMPNGNLLTSGIGEFVPVVVPAPGSSTKYYLFYIQNHGLLYSLVDMSLNHGLGDVVSTQKNILLGRYGTILDRKMVAVQGCDGAWIVVRSASQNQYLSYAITAAGISASPNISNVGNLPLVYYGAQNEPSGVLKASADGRRMAAACGTGNIYVPASVNGGLELYDVEPCSGRLLNPAVIDTGMFYGACFSPDGTKLYATKSFEQKVFQYDLSLPTTAAITASRTIILSNPNYGNFYPDEYILGELKRARDGKIYLGNHVCGGLPYTSALHVINNPDRAGLACSPVINAVPLGYVCPGMDLPADIVYGGQQDTVYGKRDTTICFRDSAFINAPPGNHCYRWVGDTLAGRSRKVKSAGRYIVLYNDDNCKLHIDTVVVSFTGLSAVAGGTYSCPGKNTGSAWIVPGNGDTTEFTYSWINSYGTILRSRRSRSGDTLGNADTGTYRIRITTAAGCDTSLPVTVRAYPVPVASFSGDTIACRHAPVRFSNTSAAPAWTWYFDGRAGGKDPSLVRVYGMAGSYPVMQVVRNVEGCTDTARKTLEVRELVLRLSASKTSASLGEEIRLSSGASKPYTVLAWKPEALFGDGGLYSQQLKVTRTATYTVVGKSVDGCVDSASATVSLSPVVFMPNAFTPNGDGLNDRFRPESAGDNILIRRFEIYNRWGQLVWMGQGRNAADGWDGTFGGRPAELGTYFYTIEAEAPSGETIAQKGDMILIR